MKSYLFLLLLVFIACDVEEKTDEIVLKDIGHDFLEDLLKIVQECGGLEEEDCIGQKLMDIYYNLSSEEIEEIKNFLLSPECQNDCVDIFKDLIKDPSQLEQTCVYICSADID